MQIFKSSSRFLIFLTLIFTCISCLQGKEVFTFADDDFFVRQGAGQCGPASFYMIFRYYGDTTFDGEFTGLPDCSEIFPLQEELTEVTEDSAVSKWLGVTDTGIAIAALKDKISRLTADRNTPWYITEGDIVKTEILLQERFLIIQTMYLNNDLPVIIHLSRPDISGIPVTGHYMVLAGYDPGKKVVYYIDPNRDEDSPVIQRVDLHDFLYSQWYESPDNMLIPNGYWDGTWIGFRHSW